jgi:hypothetical protein
MGLPGHRHAGERVGSRRRRLTSSIRVLHAREPGQAGRVSTSLCKGFPLRTTLQTACVDIGHTDDKHLHER